MTEYADRRWWAAKESEVHSQLWPSWQELRRRDSYRQTQVLHWMRLYGNKNFQALNPAAYTRANTENRLKYNVVKAVVNRIHARIAQQRPRPLPVSTGGNYSVKRRARLLGRYLDAQFRITRAHALGSRMVKDALVTNAGALKVYEDGEQVRIERALSWELFVDPVDAYYGAPRTLYQQRWMPRDVLEMLFPKKKSVIASASREPHQTTDQLFAADLMRDTRADQVLVVEAWHLPSGPKAKDGKHVIAVDTGVVEIDEWPHDYFPFVLLTWDEPLFGFWGDSVPDELAGLQAEINTYLQKIQSAHHLFGHPFIFAENAKRAAQQTFTNKIGTWIDTKGGDKPSVHLFQTLSPEIYAQADALYNKAFELPGVGQMGGGTQVPAGLPESGVGLRTFSDIQALAHLPFAQRYEAVFVDLAQQMIDRARDIAKRKGGKYAVPAARDRYTLSTIDWSEVDMERDQYFLQVFPTSSLPAEPAGKLAAVETMTRSTLIDPRIGRLLLDFPDLESETVLDRAVTEAIDRAVERMLDDGEKVTPSPYMDLQLTLKRAQAHLLVAENEGVPEDRLELLRDFLAGVHALMQQQQVEQMKVSMAAAAEQGPEAIAAAPIAPGAPPAPGPNGQPPGAVT